MRSPRLKLRRSWYTARARLGFSGYRVGSWQHGLQCILRLAPLRARRPARITKLVAGLVFWSISLAALSALGVGGAGWWALAVTAASWVTIGAVLFLRDRNRAWPTGPPTSGSREPRRPSPNQGAGETQLEPPETH